MKFVFHFLTLSLSHSLAFSLSCFLTLSLSHSLAFSLSRFLTLSLSHPLTQKLMLTPLLQEKINSHFRLLGTVQNLRKKSFFEKLPKFQFVTFLLLSLLALSSLGIIGSSQKATIASIDGPTFNQYFQNPFFTCFVIIRTNGQVQSFSAQVEQRLALCLEGPEL